MDPELMSKTSRATTYEDYVADLQRQVLRDRQVAGTAPDTLGVSVPLTPARSVEEFVGSAKSWWSDIRKRKGPQGYDMADTPMEGSYLQRRFEFIAGEEATRRTAYDDATGKPVSAAPKKGNVTVGIGFNMERPDARQVMNRVLGYSDKDFDEVYAGRKALSDLEVRKLFDYNAKEAEDVVSQRFAGVDLPEHRRLPLVSMAFNGPSLLGPKIVSAVKSGDWGAALNEMLYNSNRKGIAGLAGRRWREAAMFGGSGVSLPSFGEYMAKLFPKSKLASASVAKPAT